MTYLHTPNILLRSVAFAKNLDILIFAETQHWIGIGMVFQKCSAFRNDSWKVQDVENLEGQALWFPHFFEVYKLLILPWHWGSPHLWTFRTWVAARLKRAVRRIRPLQRPWSVVIVTFKEFLQTLLRVYNEIVIESRTESKVNLNFSNDEKCTFSPI